MLPVKISKNPFGFLFLACLLIFLPIEIAAQCGGTYFKRISTTLVPMSVNLSNVVDMNGDSIPDLVGLNVHQQDLYREVFIILPGNGSGGFGAPITFQAPDNNKIYSYIIGDFDNDNFKDVFLHYFSPSIRDQIFRNNGDGTFTAKPIQPIMQNLWLHLIDINADGKGDLISTVSNTIRYHLGNGDGSFQSPVAFANGNYAFPGDFNTDGKVDFLVGANLLINQGSAVFTTLPDTYTPGANEGILDVRDYTGDGKPDAMAFTRSANGKISLLVNTGSNSFQRTDFPIILDQQPFDSTSNGWFYTGNFSGSDSPEVLVTSQAHNQSIVFTNDGAGNFSQQTFNYYFKGFPADFDSDGKTDSAVISGTNQAQSPPHKFFNELTATVTKNVCNPVGQTRFVDFDHSGTTDFSYWTPADGKWSYLSSTNTSFPSVSVNWGAESFGDIPAPGDFDGDGTTDYAVYRNSNGTWWINRSSDSQAAAVQFGLPGDKPIVGDYDGDTISDVAVFRPSDGNWYILFMGTQSYTIVHWGTDGDKPVPEDYDGDGKTDLAVFRPSSGTWYILKSSDLNFIALQFGLGTDKPVSADYDGDGKADIAVYRESNNVLHLLRSYNFAYFSYLYGSSGDIPQPGDYDGDYLTDIVVYRPSNQSWRLFYQASPISFGASNVIPTASILRIE